MSGIDSIESPIFPSVAYPPTIFMVPMEVAMLNIVGNIIMMLVGVAVFNLNPIPFILTIVLVHVFLAIKTSKEPHMYNMIRAKFVFFRFFWQKGYKNYVNESMVKCKFVP